MGQQDGTRRERRGGTLAAMLPAVPVAAMLLAVPVPVTVAGAGPAAGTARAQTAVSNFNIPGQSLSTALADFGSQAGISIALPDEIAAGRSSQLLAGAVSHDEALRRLLSGSGLTYEFLDPKTVRVQGPPRGSELTVTKQ